MEMEMITKIDVDLPQGWQLVEYSELNHHITLIDNLGRVIRLDAESVFKYTCPACNMELFARSNHGRIKCHCGARMNPVWGEAQMCFIPKDAAKNDDEDVDPGAKV